MMKSEGKGRAADLTDTFVFWIYGICCSIVKQTYLDNWIIQIETEVIKLSLFHDSLLH